MWRFYVPAAGHKVQSKVWLTCITIPERGSILLSLSRIFEYVAKTANRGSSFAWSGRYFANLAYISGGAGFSARWLWLTFCSWKGIQDRGNESEEISYEVLLLQILCSAIGGKESSVFLPQHMADVMLRDSRHECLNAPARKDDPQPSTLTCIMYPQYSIPSEQ